MKAELRSGLILRKGLPARSPPRDSWRESTQATEHLNVEGIGVKSQEGWAASAERRRGVHSEGPVPPRPTPGPWPSA